MIGQRTLAYSSAAGLALLLFATPAMAQEATGQEDEPLCDGPRNIRATVQEDGILVEWDEYTWARAYDLYRAEGDGEFEVVAKTNGDNPMDGDWNETHGLSYFDTDVEAGASYTYKVQAYAPPPYMSDICGSVTVTAIPVFPTVVAASAAVVVGVAGYAVLRRKHE